MNLLEFFTHPVLRAPTLGTMLICLAASLVGVLVFVRKRSLLGETLSHATYPGVIFATLLGISTFSGALITALLGFGAIHLLEGRAKVRPDTALCFVLAISFGVGVTGASFAQLVNPAAYREGLAYLYGQAATLTDGDVGVNGMLVLLIASVVVLFYKELHAVSFDRNYAAASGVGVKGFDALVFVLVVLVVVIGIRSVGVLLMSAMFIAPAAAARQFTDHLWKLFLISGTIGIVCGFFGNLFSVVFALPTGPAIVLIASGVAFLSLLLAPKRGLAVRCVRIAHFRFLRQQENLLKGLWHDRVAHFSFYDRFLLFALRLRGLVERGRLTEKGRGEGARIVRLHRLWEAYLVHTLGMGRERVHKSAEEMEHVLTPEFEKALSELLDHPTVDPHEQPIPAGGLHA